MPKVYKLDGVTPVVDPSAFVHPTAVLIGDVIVGPDCYVGPGASLRGDMGQIVMKRGANFQDNCIAHTFSRGSVTIEELGNVGHGSVLHGCTVGPNALIGMNSVLMDGCVIGENAFIAALSFVRAGFEVPDNMLAAGIPAKILRELTEEERRWKKVADEDYRGIIRRSHDSLELVEALSEPDGEGPRMAEAGALPLYQFRQR